MLFLEFTQASKGKHTDGKNRDDNKLGEAKFHVGA